MRNVTIFAVGLLLLCLTGCSHNIVTFADGFGFETKFRPDQGEVGFHILYGKMLSVCVRENTAIKMTGAGSGGDGGNGETGSASASASISINVGPQITGYYVDALEAGATQKNLKEYAGESGKK